MLLVKSVLSDKCKYLPFPSAQSRKGWISLSVIKHQSLAHVLLYNSSCSAASLPCGSGAGTFKSQENNKFFPTYRFLSPFYLLMVCLDLAQVPVPSWPEIMSRVWELVGRKHPKDEGRLSRAWLLLVLFPPGSTLC